MASASMARAALLIVTLVDDAVAAAPLAVEAAAAVVAPFVLDVPKGGDASDDVAAAGTATGVALVLIPVIAMKTSPFKRFRRAAYVLTAKPSPCLAIYFHGICK
ncbi:hypothetical protein [Caballeronia sordidicola]|uniref:hypothetical protein n=1 Tax=Caballeronia sordidicola TaxID=196367 RepID=UPI00117BF12C|nr:hypothetical protein [Caballeronia sordidicola]